jgi:hypothetical protein
VAESSSGGGTATPGDRLVLDFTVNQEQTVRLIGLFTEANVMSLK